MLGSLENSQNLLRQQEAKVRAWFTLFFFGEAELLAQVLGNDAKSPITRFLILTNLITI